MDYMARTPEPRRDLRVWMPEARSVLMCAFSYGDPAHKPAPKPGHGRVARYATRPDYHERLRARMDAVRDWLKTVAPDARGVAFCDMSPLLERSYARAAGLGWQGKNAMLIAPTLGSYFLIAGLALDVELPTDEPQLDHCGTCRRCLDACPTDAFPRERVLDASKCVAYFTIEDKGPVPEEFRAGVGDWVFGCDVCQEVCPWNRFEKPARALPPARVPTEIPLEELAGPASDGLRKRFKGLPIAKAVRRRITRSAALAMGNSGDPRFRPTLEKLAADPDAAVAEHARWALARTAKPDAGA
jgi:epoxyqueuosine reductase